jgi:hypothetical protein
LIRSKLGLDPSRPIRVVNVDGRAVTHQEELWAEPGAAFNVTYNP